VGPLKKKGGKNKWLDHLMQIFAAFMLCGLGTTFLVPETKRKSLEELAHQYHDEPVGCIVAEDLDMVIEPEKC